MYLKNTKIGYVVRDPSDDHTLSIESISGDLIEVKVIKPPKNNNWIEEKEIGKTYWVDGKYGGNTWKYIKNVKKPAPKAKTELEKLKEDLQKAKVHVEEIEAAIKKVHESLALKPGTMYQSDSHFNGLCAIFVGEYEGNFEFYLGGEYRDISISPDDFEKFKPMNLPNQRKMAKAIFDFLEGRIPNN